MPLIPAKIKGDNIIIDDVTTVVLDVDKTQELAAQEQTDLLGLSYKAIQEMRNKYATNEAFQQILNSTRDEYWIKTKKNVESVSIFYDIVWQRTRIELLYMSEYYTKELTDPLAFEFLQNNLVQFTYWFNNTVKYNLLVRLRRFYINAAKNYAQLVPIDIYEQDIEFKAKEAIDIIEQSYLDDVQTFLKMEWNKAETYHRDVFKAAQEKKRKAMLFD